MKAIIHIQGRINPSLSVAYELELNEYTRLLNDFDQYQKTGLPKTGLYTCKVSEEGVKLQNQFFLEFDKVISIE